MKVFSVLSGLIAAMSVALGGLALLMTVTACSGGTQIGTPSLGSISGTEKKKKTSTSLDDGDSDEVFKDANGNPITPTEVTENIEFPKFKFSGSGQTSNDGKGYATTSLVVTELFSDTFILDQLDANVITPSKQTEATADIRANAVGKTTYKRATLAERKLIKDSSGKLTNVSYVIFATGVTDVKGNQFTFSSALPVFPYPGEKARYTDLIAAPVTWTAKVTGKGQVFDVNMTATAVDVSSDVVRIIITTNIPSDTDGSLYELFPPAQRGEYTINTPQKRVAGMRQTYWFYADGNQYSSKRKETVEMTYSLCSVTKKGATEQVSSCP